MNRRNLGLSLIVGLAALVVAAGTVTAHGAVDPGLGMPLEDATTAGEHWWMASHVATQSGWGAGLGSAVACGPATAGMMGGWVMGTSGLWGLGSLWPLLLLALVVAVGYFVVTGRPDAGDDRALQLLRERYATGELSEEEYERRREALRT